MIPLPIVCLNLRAGGGRQARVLRDYLTRLAPATVVLTEWRNNEMGALFRHWAHDQGMHCAGLTDGGTPNGVFVASRASFRYASATPPTGGPGVLMLAQFRRWRLLACYFPSVMNKPPFFAACETAVAAHGRAPFLMIGDLNTGNDAADREAAGVRYASAARFDALPLVDLWRHTHGGAAREFTWHSHRNNGFRLDHALANPAFVARTRPVCAYDHTPRRERWTDHSAIVLRAASDILQ